MIDFKSAREKAYEFNSKNNSTRILSDAEKVAVGLNHVGELWEIKVEIQLKNDKQKEVIIYLLLDDDFPLTFPEAYLSKEDYDNIRYIPHVDTTRTICYVDKVLNIPNTAQPPELVVQDCIQDIKEVLRQGMMGENSVDFNAEFIAYWEGVYPHEELLISHVYSLIGTIGDKGIGVISYLLDGSHYRFYLHTYDYMYEQLKEYLKQKNINFEEFVAFYAGETDIDKPSFALTNKQLLERLNAVSQRCFDDFRKFLNKGKGVQFVIFNKKIGLVDNYIGWVVIVDLAKKNRKGFPPNSIDNFRVISTFDSGKYIRRISPMNMTKERLAQRSIGNREGINQFSFLIGGLGSVGSNLVHFLNSLPVKEYTLVDPEVLVLENTGRHLLGYSSIGKGKALAMQEHINDKQPLQKVNVRTNSVTKVISEEHDLINSLDYLFIAIGRYNHEKWINDQQSAGILKKPVFYLWVEPYLAGGHILYIHPDDNRFTSFFDERTFYRFNVISQDCYANNKELRLREAGCQSTYTPYSIENVVDFLSAALPQIKNTLQNPDTKSWGLTWVGDKEALERLGVEFSPFGNENQTGSLLIY